MNNNNQIVILAFSGGLDTSFCVKWLQEEAKYKVHTVTVDTGGFDKDELARINETALNLGAVEHHTINAVDEVYERFGSYLIKGNVLRGGVYPLVVGAERVIQAEKIAQIALERGAAAVAHGSTGAGNDQVRFDVVFKTLAPSLKIITPIRDLALSREQEVQFLAERGIVMSGERKKYSINQGIFGVTIGGGETHDPWNGIPEEAYTITKNIADVPKEIEQVVIGFDQGLPVSINGQKETGRLILEKLNQIGGRHGFGRGVHVGDTILGIKGRIAFEAPGMLSLIMAHQELEKIVLTKSQLEWKATIGQFYGSYLHEARWYDPVMRDWESFIDSSQQRVTGDVRLGFHQGRCVVEGCRSPYSILSAGAKYGEGSSHWSGQEAGGFCSIYGTGAALYRRVGK